MINKLKLNKNNERCLRSTWANFNSATRKAHVNLSNFKVKKRKFSTLEIYFVIITIMLGYNKYKKTIINKKVDTDNIENVSSAIIKKLDNSKVVKLLNSKVTYDKYVDQDKNYNVEESNKVIEKFINNDTNIIENKINSFKEFILQNSNIFEKNITSDTNLNSKENIIESLDQKIDVREKYIEKLDDLTILKKERIEQLDVIIEKLDDLTILKQEKIEQLDIILNEKENIIKNLDSVNLENIYLYLQNIINNITYLLLKLLNWFSIDLNIKWLWLIIIIILVLIIYKVLKILYNSIKFVKRIFYQKKIKSKVLVKNKNFKRTYYSNNLKKNRIEDLIKEVINYNSDIKELASWGLGTSLIALMSYIGEIPKEDMVIGIFAGTLVHYGLWKYSSSESEMNEKIEQLKVKTENQELKIELDNINNKCDLILNNVDYLSKDKNNVKDILLNEEIPFFHKLEKLEEQLLLQRLITYFNINIENNRFENAAAAIPSKMQLLDDFNCYLNLCAVGEDENGDIIYEDKLNILVWYDDKNEIIYNSQDRDIFDRVEKLNSGEDFRLTHEMATFYDHQDKIKNAVKSGNDNKFMEAVADMSKFVKTKTINDYLLENEMSTVLNIKNEKLYKAPLSLYIDLYKQNKVKKILFYEYQTEMEDSYAFEHIEMFTKTN